MKIGIKKKDFLDKVTLQGMLETKLKKPVYALKTGKVPQLPFCYEVALFDDGMGFLCIGEAKEIQQLYKTKRVKGQGQDENGKVIKIDKKKGAYGGVQLNSDSAFEFFVANGIMKPKEVKGVIKRIGVLKKAIGENFIITKGLPQDVPQEDTTTTDEEATTTDEDTTTTTDDDGKKTDRQAKLDTMEQNIGRLQNAVGVVEADKVHSNLNKYKQALDRLIQQAEQDGVVDKDEQKQIDKLSSIINKLEKQLERLGDRKIKLTPKRRAKVRDNMSTIDQRIKDLLSKLNL